MKTHSTFRKRAIASAMAMFFAVGAVLPASNAEAGVPVIDYTAIINAIREYVQEGLRWAKTAQQYKAQLARLQRMQYSLNLGGDNMLKEIDVNEGVREACPGAPLTSPAGMLNMVGLSSGADIAARQRQVCAEIKRTSNKKFNKTVAMLKEIQQEANQQISRLSNQSQAAGSNTGDVVSVQADIQIYAQSFEAKVKNYETAMTAYDQYTAYLKEYQRVLGRQAMRGSGGVGNLIQAGTLQRELK